MLVSQQNHFNTEELLLYSEKFSNLTATERSDLINNHLDIYTSIIKLLITSLLNKWSLSSQEQINSDYIYARNTILFSLEAFLDTDVNITIGTLNLDVIKNVINVLSASLYYDNNIISRYEYVNNNEINFISGILHYWKSDIECQYGFDHQLSFALLGVFIPAKKILNQHIFKSKFIIEENENILLRYKNDIDIVDELFSLYDIENVLYESKNLFNNKNILPDGLYYINEYNSMVKGSNSLFDVFSKILENLNEYFKKVFFSEYIEGNDEKNDNKEKEENNNIENENDEDFNEYDIYLNKCIKNNIFLIYSNGISIKWNSNNEDTNISNYEIENIKCLMPLTVSELNIDDQFSQYLTNLNSTIYLIRDDIENSNDNVEYNNIDNQLVDELFLFSKYSDGFIGIDKNGNVTMNTSDFNDYVENIYHFPPVSSLDIENNSDFSNIVQSKYLNNFYGEYYLDDIIETSEFTTYKNTGRKFQFVTDTTDDKFIIYNIRYILNQGSSVLSNEYNNINHNLNKFKFKSRFEMVEKMENYINTLKKNNYEILYLSEDIEMLNILKYYIINQSPFIRDSKIIGLIKEIDEPFIKKNMLLYNIYDAKELLEMEKLSMKDIYTLLIQSYWYESPDIIKSFINDIQQYNNEDFDFSLFEVYNKDRMEQHSTNNYITQNFINYSNIKTSNNNIGNNIIRLLNTYSTIYNLFILS
ncbi:hypothetical protein H8356DRAFT_1351454 [Neocallimastix lanati (nom. inval.)]|nr:hypothetical protein H8356DRAFT_1351454 [Neocallimastix sp. JGI-2020a]